MKAAERVVNPGAHVPAQGWFHRRYTSAPYVARNRCPMALPKAWVVEPDKMLPEFYKVRGWDEKGWPGRKRS
ncbi:MAG: hypothetical protein IPN96_12045 [Anaerolineales bacterium]|nr:hypothetical protein [Anaerolineales bacterium]